IASLKVCKDFNLPIFVVISPDLSSNKRNVELGWVRDHDDNSGQLLIEFLDIDSTNSPPSNDKQTWDDKPFSLLEERSDRYSRAKQRPNQYRFRFDVLKRYGATCAVCNIQHSDLLQAAHLCPVEAGGSDDPRNGLIFCLTHHCAFDKSLFWIHPDTLY